MALDSMVLLKRRSLKRKQAKINSNVENELRLELIALSESELADSERILVEVPKKDLVTFTSILADGSLPWLSFRRVDTLLFELWTENLL